MRQAKWWQKTLNKQRQRVEITIETESEMVIRARGSARAWCAACQAESLMLTPLAAAQMTGSSTRLIYRRIEEASLHFAETTDGALFICHASLLVALRLKPISEKQE